MNLLQLIIGIVLLFFGRKVFWLFVGLTGFLIGYSNAPQFLNIESPLVLFVIAIFIGLIGAVLAIVLQRFAIAVSGFLAGMYITQSIFQVFALNPEFVWLLSIIAGILGAILMWFLFDYALIFLSSIIGALAIINAGVFAPGLNVLIFIILFLIGLVVQLRLYMNRT